jgi:hypothetical protein
MRRVICALVCGAALNALAPAGPLLFYFSRSNNFDAVPPEFTAGQVISDALPGETLYLWARVTPDDIWNGIFMNISGADIAAGTAYNPVMNGGPPQWRRWETSSDFDPTGDGNLGCVAVNTAGLGSVWDPMHVAEHFLFAELAFAEPGAVFLWGDMARQGGVPGEDPIYFGFTPWGSWDPAEYPGGPYSEYADLVVVIPEPGAGLLLALIAAFPVRRRV